MLCTFCVALGVYVNVPTPAPNGGGLAAQTHAPPTCRCADGASTGSSTALAAVFALWCANCFVDPTASISGSTELLALKEKPRGSAARIGRRSTTTRLAPATLDDRRLTDGGSSAPAAWSPRTRSVTLPLPSTTMA